MPDKEVVRKLLAEAHYSGSPKHKKHPHLFNLPPFLGERGDATLCDTHAGFMPEHMRTIPDLLRRGIQAGLIGKNQVIWTVGDNGWIYECRLTNIQQAEYHGYPVRPSEPIGELVYRRFATWVEQSGSELDRQAAIHCKALYRFK